MKHQSAKPLLQRHRFVGCRDETHASMQIVHDLEQQYLGLSLLKMT